MRVISGLSFTLQRRCSFLLLKIKIAKIKNLLPKLQMAVELNQPKTLAKVSCER